MRRLLIVAAAAVGVVACGYAAPASPGGGQQAVVAATTPVPSPGQFSFADGQNLKPITFPDGLKIVDIAVGQGPAVQVGDSVGVHYTGWLTDGTQFDSNDSFCADLSGNQTAQGAACSSVIPGWNEGIPGMKVGGKRRIQIPATLAYGSQAQGPIPANSTLVFEIQVNAIVKHSPAPSPGASASPSPTASPSPSHSP